MDKDLIISELIRRIDELSVRVAFLEKENALLKEQLRKYQNQKNSRNSLVSPSKDEMFNDIFGLSISEGGIHYLLNRFAEKTRPVYEKIRQVVANSISIGADETGVKINGIKAWFWTWQTPKSTFNLNY